MTGPDAAGGGPPAPEQERAAFDRDDAEPWLRLDRRMLLVHPVQEVVKFLPAVIGAVILGVSSGNPLYSLLGLVFVIPYALTLWFTTTYRVGSTHVELRTGLIRRKRLSVPRARIRSVDIEADPLHRVLGLAVVVIGTGREADADDRFRLDALAAEHVRPLRTELLAHTREVHIAADASVPAHLPDTGEPTGSEEPGGEEIAHWQPGWVRYAPLSLTGFALAASALGVAAQFGFGSAEISISRNTVDSVRDIGLLPLLLLAFGALAAMVAVVSIAACAHYLTTNFGLRVTDYGSTLQIRRGLFTLRRITLDTARLRGATIREPLLLRLAGAAQLEAVMTGENPRQKILPQSPRAAVERTLARLLSPHRNTDISAVPAAAPAQLSTLADVPLTRHGPAARRRRYIRACWPVPLSAAVLIATSMAGPHVPGWWWLLPLVLTVVCALLAEDRYRGLGHTVVPAADGSPTWLIVRSGSLDRERTCLEAPGIIGWTVRQTFWQRRAGLATVGAATAAGKKLYLIEDIPLDRAWDLLYLSAPPSAGRAGHC
ncbi:PH domain-containing protein [Nocardia jinanensis]|uniref:Membrane protein n=1 Tax=Nocardia jinanensis TaxID=382504 RepID=A0A917RTT1_9NOCA|nr:PH domain-containing protein [Nocardia jinanensis]GGL29829.1 membrane protein [Nocardia jinanensis]